MKTNPIVKRAMRERARLGIYPSAAPLGYLNVRVSGISVLKIDPIAGPLIRQAFILAEAGHSVRSILRILTAKGLRSRRGKKLTPSALWRILQNPLYRGVIVWTGEEIQGTHEPLSGSSGFTGS
jgi:hypothetical protein